MNLKEIGTEFTMPMKREGTYHVHFPPEDYLCLIAGAKLGSAGARFDHENVSAVVPRVHEFKHYHPKRGKWWSESGGFDFYFIIPKDRIEIVEEVGYSYPKIRIGGRVYTLNVSGGTFPEGDWTDTVRQGSHTGVGHTKKSLQILAENSLPPEECQRQGIELILPPMDRPETFRALYAKKIMQRALAPGLKVILKKGRYYDLPGNRGPFQVETVIRRRRKLYARDRGWRIQMSYKDIDWLDTAEENGVKGYVPETVNHIGKTTKEKAG